MKIPPFESEYDNSALPKVVGDPLGNEPLNVHVLAMNPIQRVESSQRILILDAVQSFYLAKRYRQIVLSFDGYTNVVVPLALDAIGENLLRLAVIAVASVNDHDRIGRSKSLPHSIDALSRALESVGDQHASAEMNRLKEIKRSINADVVLSLKYLRHVRNKWAGHASLDREFDDWAKADTDVSLPLVEDALVRLVSAHQDLADLIDRSEVLGRLAAESQDSEHSDNPDSRRVMEMGVDWGPVTVWAGVFRGLAGRAAEALVDQLQSPPGYGTENDTDWSAGSEHQRQRSLIDEAADQALKRDG